FGRRARFVARSPRRCRGSGRQCADGLVSAARNARRRRAQAGRHSRHPGRLRRSRRSKGRVGGESARRSFPHRARADGRKRNDSGRGERPGEARNMSGGGKLVGVGVGPGDPELITLKAIGVLERADVVAHFAKSAHAGNARATAARYLKPDVRELSLVFPVTTELPKDEERYCNVIRTFYDDAAREEAGHIDDTPLIPVKSHTHPPFYTYHN